MDIDPDGPTLHVEEHGNPDGPVVLFLHGITSSTSTWDWVVPELAATHRVLRLDFRGHGQSGRAPGTYHFPSYLADAISVCEQVAGKPCVVVGHSLGGGTAAALAQQRPDLVVGVLLEDPALFDAADRAAGLDENNPLRMSFGLLREAIPMLQASNMSVDQVVASVSAAPTANGSTLGDTMQPDALRSMASSMLLLDASVLDPVLDGTMVAAFDAEAIIPVPVTVLAADPSSPDVVAGPAVAAKLAQVSPHADFRVVPGAGHLIHDSIAHRGTFRDAVVQFLEANPPR
jgi:pimeloyl-ACP methyl ester carboxylesterase